MSMLTMSRRSFTKAAAATAAALVLAGGTKPLTALADSTLDETEDTAPVADEIKRIRTCCRGCGKCECGVWVTVVNGRAVKVEGDESAYATQGNCCIKSQASMQAAYHPDRLRYPMKRTNPKGDKDPGWVRISWDEAFDLVYQNLNAVVEKYGTSAFVRKSGTSRIWGNHGTNLQHLWPNNECGYIGGVQVCKGPRNTVGRVTIENSAHFFATNDYPAVYCMWGTDQTQSNYDDAGRVVNDVAQRAKTRILVDPRISNGGKEAEIHLPLRPGSDNEMALGWTRVVMEERLYDDTVVRYWTNAPFLVCEDMEPSGWTGVKYNRDPNLTVTTRLLKEIDVDPKSLPWKVEGEGNPRRFLVWDEAADCLTYFDADESADNPHAGMWEKQTEHDIPTTGYEYRRGGWVPDFPDLSKYCVPEIWNAEGRTVTLKDGREVTVKTVWQKYWDDSVSEWTLEKTAEYTDVDAELINKAVHAWAERPEGQTYGNGINFQLGLEQSSNCWDNYRTLMVLFLMCDAWDVPGSHRGLLRNPLDGYGNRPAKWPADPRPFIEKYNNHPGMKQFPFLRWIAAVFQDATSTYQAMLTGDPLPVRAFLEFASGMCQQSNPTMIYEALKTLDFHFVYDLWYTVGNGLADVILPAQHWMEIPGFTRKCQNATGNIGANCNCIEPIGDTKFDLDITIGIFKAFGTPWYDPEDGLGDAWDRPITCQLDKMVSGMGMTWAEFEERFQKEGWWDNKVLEPKQWGTYRRYLVGEERSKESGLNRNGDIPGFSHPTMKMEIWSTIVESVEGEHMLPRAQEPCISRYSTPELLEEYPICLTTGARVSSYFHSEHRQLPWCREVALVPKIYMHSSDAEKYGLAQGDWAWVESKDGIIRLNVDIRDDMRPGTANADHHWWFPEFTESEHGFRLCNVNCLVDPFAQDPVLGSSELRGYYVKVYKATPENSPFGNPVPCDSNGTPIIHTADDARLKTWQSQIEEIAADTTKWEVYA